MVEAPSSSTSSSSSDGHRNSTNTAGSKTFSSNNHSDPLSSLLPPPLSLLPINPPPLDQLFSFAACNPSGQLSDSGRKRRSSTSDGDRRGSTGSSGSGSNSSTDKRKDSSIKEFRGFNTDDEANRRRSGGVAHLSPPTSPTSKRITIKDRNKPLPQPPVPTSPPSNAARSSGSVSDESSTSPVTASSGVGLGLELDLKTNRLPSSSFLVLPDASGGSEEMKLAQGGRRRSSFLGLRRKSTSITPSASGSSPLLSSPILGGFRSRRKVSGAELPGGDLNLSQEKSPKKEAKELSKATKRRSFSTSTRLQPGSPSCSNPTGSSLGLFLAGATATAYSSPLIGMVEMETRERSSKPSGSETDLKQFNHQEETTRRSLASLSIAPLPLDSSLEAAIDKLKKSVLADPFSCKGQTSTLSPTQTPRLSSSATSTPKIQQLQSPAGSERHGFGKPDKLLESVFSAERESSSPNLSESSSPWEETKEVGSNRRWRGIKTGKIKSKTRSKNETDSPLVNECFFASIEPAAEDAEVQKSNADELEAVKKAMIRLGWAFGSDQVKLFCGQDSRVKGLERSNFLGSGAEIDAIVQDDLSLSSHSLQYKPKPILSPHSTLLRKWSNFTSIYFNSELSLEEIPSFPPYNVPSPVFCPSATPISCGPLIAVAPIWERERQLALDRLELHSLDSSTLEKITNLVLEAKESLKAADAVISILEGEDTFVISSKSDNGSTLKSPLERASTICGHTLFNRNKGQFITNVKDDWRFAGGPSAEKWGFYAGMPICNSAGMPVATLCTFDHEPRSEVSAEERLALRDIATRIGNELELAYAERYQAKLKRIQDSYSRLSSLLVVDPAPFAQIVGSLSASYAPKVPVRIKLPRYHTQIQKREVKRIARESGEGSSSGSTLAALTLDKAGGSVLPYDLQKPAGGLSDSNTRKLVEALGPESKLLSFGLHVSKNNQERFDSITALISEALQLETVYLVALDRQIEGDSSGKKRRSSTKVVLQDPKLDSTASTASSPTSPTSTTAAAAETPSVTKSNATKQVQNQPQKNTCGLISYSGPSLSSAKELDPDLYRRVLSTADSQGLDDVKGLIFQNRAEIGVDDKIGIGMFSSSKKGLWREASSLPAGGVGSNDDGRVFIHQCGIFVAIEVDTRAPQVTVNVEANSTVAPEIPRESQEAQNADLPRVGFVLSALTSSARRVLGFEDLRYLQSISSALGALILVCQRDGDGEQRRRETFRIELLKQKELTAKAKEASPRFDLRRTISLETTASVPNPSASMKPPGISTKNRKGLNGKSGKSGNLSLALPLGLPSVGIPLTSSFKISPRETPKTELAPTSPLAFDRPEGLERETMPTSPLQPKKDTMAKAFAKKASGAAQTAANTASATASNLYYKMPSVNPALMLPTSVTKAEREKRRSRNSSSSASPVTPDFFPGPAPLVSPKALQPVFSYGYDLPDSIEAQEEAIRKREKLSVNVSKSPRRASLGGVDPVPSPLEFEPMGALWNGGGLKPSPRTKGSPRPSRSPPPRPDQKDESCFAPPLSPFSSVLTPPLDEESHFDLPISPLWSSGLLSPDPSLPSAKSDFKSQDHLLRPMETSRPSLRERRTTSVSLKVIVSDWSEELNPHSQSA